jgi:hypothetical protein
MSFWQRLTEPAEVVVCGASRGFGLALTEQLLARTESELASQLRAGIPRLHLLLCTAGV